jgi:hypothetical protein
MGATMTRVLAMLDDSPQAPHVLAAATTIARLLHCDLDAVNVVLEQIDRTPSEGLARAEPPDDTLRTMAQELVKTVRANVTIDWTLRENVRAQLRVLVKRILRRYGYPPDKQEKATQTVLEQAALLSAEWAVA